MKFLSVLLFGFALACSQGGSNNDFVSENKAIDYDMAKTEGVIEEGEISEINPSTPEKQEQKIIKTARLEFETKDPDAVHKKILLLTKQYSGFVQSDNSGKGYGRINRNMVIRIPTENFQMMVDGVSEGIEYFDQKDISRKDVTEEFVDLQARLKAKRELENRYLQLLKQAKNVKEMLEIERELSKIREEIEAKEGRLKYLESKVSLSTLFIGFYKTSEIKGIKASYGQKMKNALQGGWNGVSMFFIGILYLWPLFLIVIIVAFFIRRYIKKRQHKKV